MLVFFCGGLLLMAGATESLALIGPVGSNWCAALGASMMAGTVFVRALRKRYWRETETEPYQEATAA
ncbi:MAG: hypothetical protein AAGF97_03665 [Planctomycetota bacterium]